MPTTNTTIISVASASFPTPDWQGTTASPANASTDSVTWGGTFASSDPLLVKLQNPVILRVTSNDFENPASCSVYVYFDIDNGVSADEAEALWLAGLLKKIEPAAPDRPSLRVLELKFTANTALKLLRSTDSGTPVNVDGSAASTGSTLCVPSELYNLLKMTAKEMMANATTKADGTAMAAADYANPRTQIWPRLAFNKFSFRLYNNIAGMPTSGLVVGSTLMAELVSATADLTTATSDGLTTYYTAVTGREFDSKIFVKA